MLLSNKLSIVKDFFNELLHTFRIENIFGMMSKMKLHTTLLCRRNI